MPETSIHSTSPGSALRARIVALADQCVKCGLCQPQCPTYHIGRQEAESPRGRIALAKALAQDTLQASGLAGAVQHLDQCLACMRCERVCPSQVHYGELLVATRALQRQSRTGRAPPARFDAWLRRPRWLRALLRVANLPGLRQCIQNRILMQLWQRLALDRAVRELPHLPRRPVVRSESRHAAASGGRIGLFLGCLAAVADRDVHVASRRLLEALGYEVIEPRAQGCCGALALHDGDIAAAHALAASTRDAFLAANIDTVLVSASGCFGALRDVAFGGGGVRVREIHEFLDSHAAMADLKFQPLPHRIALHTPCTQANVARADGAVRRLLQRIPHMEIVPLPDVPGCCGAGGDYFLRHAGIADALRGEKLDQVAASSAQLLVTSNVGCRVFLDNGLRRRARPLRVVHPIVLLAEQLDN